MDLYVLRPLPLYWIPAKFESALVVTLDDNGLVELDTQLSEEVL